PGRAYFSGDGSHDAQKEGTKKYSWQTVSGIRNQMFHFRFSKKRAVFLFHDFTYPLRRLYEAADFIIRQRCSFYKLVP
ncbi:hypothetical protein CLOSTHATH_04880, partial [Hungatella hathewayi DSM 13479]